MIRTCGPIPRLDRHLAARYVDVDDRRRADVELLVGARGRRESQRTKRDEERRERPSPPILRAPPYCSGAASRAS